MPKKRTRGERPQPPVTDRQRKRQAGRRTTSAVTQLLDLFEAAMGANDSDSLQNFLLVALEATRRCAPTEEAII